METVNISFDITPSTTPMRFSLGVTPLKSEIPQTEVAAVVVPEEHKPATEQLRITEPEVHFPAEVTTFPHAGTDPGVNGMLSGYEN